MKLYEYINQNNGHILNKTVYVARISVLSNATYLSMLTPTKVMIKAKVKFRTKIKNTLENAYANLAQTDVTFDEFCTNTIEQTLLNLAKHKTTSDNDVIYLHGTDMLVKALDLIDLTRFRPNGKLYSQKSNAIVKYYEDARTRIHPIQLYNEHEDANIGFGHMLDNVESYFNTQQKYLDRYMRQSWRNDIDRHRKDYAKYVTSRFKIDTL